ncbi:MAG TPA: multicopper oxidase domain-containing protein [Terriglobales bacterium]|nr:multicopper oxidase domain-containing protein [Terriglobales bacterium]
MNEQPPADPRTTAPVEEQAPSAEQQSSDRPKRPRLLVSRRALGLAGLLSGALGLTKPASAQSNDVPIPETPSGTTVAPTAGADGIKRATLTVQYVNQVLLNADGKQVIAQAIGFAESGGSTPGPTLVFYEGDQVAITVNNRIDQPFAIHWHGVIVPNSQDGVPEIGQPTPLIPPGGSYTYRYQIVQPAGTHMYHSHVDIRTEMLGLTGGFIILPKNNTGPRKYDRDVIFWLHEWNLPQDLEPQIVVGSRIMSNPAMRDRPYTGSPADTVNSVSAKPNWQLMEFNFLTMNGKAHPSHTPLQLRLGERLRVRFFNIGVNSHPMHFHGQNFFHIAEDGVDLKQPQEMNTIEVAPGKTQDILITAMNPGVWPLHCHISHHQANNFSSGFGGMAFVINIA